MFAKLTGWTALIERVDAERDRAIADLVEARTEIRHLTDAIIHMKEERMVLDPVQSDDKWPGGRYSFSDVEDEGQPPFTERETQLAEVELQQELRDVLND